MRKDGKSQYQIKKEKLKQIKAKINYYHKYWTAVRANKLRGNTTIATYDSYNLLDEIWEIVKDE